ncbi:Acyl-phosphate:glycerol-3-phosphate O-acyltransferase PlsY [uncultured Gammaproteobacteria bacterium]|nr:Acyl-phosphate:glycerol-3-phosphate O-acyltransferase PlsY [uncultured Gammaproteobacteria bacterium]
MLPILIIAGYLIGSLSSAILVCKAFDLPDPRTQGSNNPGATNVLRIGGKKAAAITLIGDGLRALFLYLIARYLGADLLAMTLIVFASFLGHVYPIFFGFKGGKGVATFLGGLFALNYFSGIKFCADLGFCCQSAKNFFAICINRYSTNPCNFFTFQVPKTLMLLMLLS